MIKLRHLFLAGLACGLTLLLNGCHAALMDPKGPIAITEKDLLIDAVLLMCIIVVPVIIATLVIAYKYRASNQKAKYTPDWAHGMLLEAGWWIMPIIIVVILGVMTWKTSHELDPYKPLDSNVKPVTIQVISLDWRWLFIYPDQHIATINFVEFPVNTPVNFLITSDAPMNSFMIQQLAGQIYSMAGMQTKLHLMANQVGDYNGRSVSFSGNGFSNMQFVARATTNDQFNQWVEGVQKAPNALTMTAYNQLALPSNDTGVYYFSNVADNLFNDVIMKYMGPDMKNMQMSSTPSEGTVPTLQKMENMDKTGYTTKRMNS